MLTKMDEGAWLEFSRQIRESIEAVDIIKSDCDRCEEESKRDSSEQFFRRALIRNICAYVEAFLYTMSRGPRHICALAKEESAKSVQRTFGCTISDENLRLLDDEKGSRLSFKERFKRVIQIFDQVYRFAGQIDYEKHSGWEAVWKTFRVRDRLVHPKSGAELEIKEAELFKAREGFQWAHKLMAERVGHAAKMIDEMSR